MKACTEYVCLVMASLLLSAGPLSGAGILILQGRVTDVRGRPVPGAEIRLTDSGGRLQYRVLSDMRGMYRIPPLPNLAEAYRIRTTVILHELGHVTGAFGPDSTA